MLPIQQTSQSKVVQEYKYQEGENIESIIEANSEEINLAARALATTIGIEPTEEDTNK